MLISRGLASLRSLRRLAQTTQLNQITRNSHDWNYRSGPTPAKEFVLGAEIVQGIAWWWVLWHLWTEPDHILGEFPYPDPSKWTDEELGIPQD